MMLSFIQSALPFYGKLNKEEQSLLNNSIYLKNFTKGTVMHAGRDDCSGLFLIEEGVIRAYILSESGKEVTLYRLFSRDICIFSASCIMKNISFDIFVEAITDTKAYIIPTDVFNILQKNSLAVSDYTNQLISSRFSDVMWVLEQTLFSSFDKRLAGFLLEMSEIEESDVLAITHEQIARNLGTAREVVSRMLKYFEENGYISMNRKAIKLVDFSKLSQIAK